ncbi:MAG: GNAT family N-acetyltransferase [Anaerolineaceae bacterium]
MEHRTRSTPDGKSWNWDEYHTVILTDNDAFTVQVLFEECQDFTLLVTALPAADDEGQKLFSDLPQGMKSEDKTVFGLFTNTKLVGVIDSIDGYPTEGMWFIGLFLLHPGCRGNGTGRVWLKAYEAYARAGGAKCIRLGVVEQNTRGRSFWEKNGFSFEARRPPVRYGNKDNIVLVMRKELG